MKKAGSEWRKKLAERIGRIYGANPQVDAIILGGSTARNHVDRFSDIELGIFWLRAPTDEERAEMARQTGGDVLRLYPFDENEQVWSDDLMLGRKTASDANSGVLLEIVHHTNSFIENTFEEVLGKYNPDE